MRAKAELNGKMEKHDVLPPSCRQDARLPILFCSCPIFSQNYGVETVKCCAWLTVEAGGFVFFFFVIDAAQGNDLQECLK